jgi:hypothetical protein
LVLKVRDERIESRSELVASQIKYPLYRADVVLYGRHYGSQAEAGEDEEEEKKSPETFPIRTRGDSRPPTTWQQRDKQINHPVFEHAKPTRGEIRSIGRSFRNGKKKGPTICDARFLNDDERIAVAPLLVGRSAPQFSPNSKFTICYPSYTSWKRFQRHLGGDRKDGGFLIRMRKGGNNV